MPAPRSAALRHVLTFALPWWVVLGWGPGPAAAAAATAAAPAPAGARGPDLDVQWGGGEVATDTATDDSGSVGATDTPGNPETTGHPETTGKLDAADTPETAGPPDTAGKQDADGAHDTGNAGVDAGPPVVARVVLAGDSWASGLIKPLREGMDARGFKTVALSHQHTTHAGSQAEGWVANQHPPKAAGGVDKGKPKMLDALMASLDKHPKATVLVLSVGADDYNRECDAGLGELSPGLQTLALDKIQKDVSSIVDSAIATRPHLHVVIFGYDFFHFEFLKSVGLKLKGHTTKSYNEGLVALEKRRLKIADTATNVYFAHNLGLLQHVFGDGVHPPFSIPNPQTGQPAYKPGVAPKPGTAPSYKPLPGGFVTYPAPLDRMPDGIHPDKKGFDALVKHTFDQGLQKLLQTGNW